MFQSGRSTSIMREEERAERKRVVVREFCVRGEDWKKVGLWYKLNAGNEVLYAGERGLQFRHTDGATFNVASGGGGLVVGEFKNGRIHFQEGYFTLHTLGKDVVPSHLPPECGDVVISCSSVYHSLRGLWETALYLGTCGLLGGIQRYDGKRAVSRVAVGCLGATAAAVVLYSTALPYIVGSQEGKSEEDIHFGVTGGSIMLGLFGSYITGMVGALECKMGQLSDCCDSKTSPATALEQPTSSLPVEDRSLIGNSSPA